MLKLVVFIPSTHKEEVKNALFAAGAGRQGNYSNCSFEVEGVGQFCPNEAAKPFLGEQEQLEKVKEFRVEFLLSESNLKSVLNSLKKSHPYEEPAYDIIKLYDLKDSE